MAEEKYINQARSVYKTLCKTLDGMGWKYDTDEEELSISTGANGDDIPINIRMTVNPEIQLLTYYSLIPFEIPEDKRVELALAVTMINYLLVDGSFDYDFLNGKIIFRMTSSFKDSLVGEELIEYMIFVSCHTVDEYNDKLEAVVKGEMTVQDFAEFISNK